MRNKFRIMFCLLFGIQLILSVQAQTRMKNKSEETTDSIRTVYSDAIYFSLNQCDWIERSQYKKVGQLLQWALSDTITPIIITGWSDATGPKAFNERLSLRRARTVRNYLVNKGVDAQRIRFEGCGIDKQAANDEEARRVDVCAEIRLIAKPETAVSEQEPPKQEAIAEEKSVAETPSQQEIIEAKPETQSAVVAVPRSQDARTASRWYVGIELGMPLGVGTFTSFASSGKVGFEGGVLGGYRISPLLSAEVGISLGSMRLGVNECCSDYWLGTDGVRYLSPVAGMDSYSYRNIHSSVSVQQYALRLNVELLQIIRPNWNKRWSLTISPTIYGIGTQATLKENATKTTIVKRDGRFQFGAGAGIGGSYQMTENLGIGLRSGLVWVFGEHFDGTTPSDHKENMIWNNTVTLIWRLGNNK